MLERKLLAAKQREEAWDNNNWLKMNGLQWTQIERESMFLWIKSLIFFLKRDSVPQVKKRQIAERFLFYYIFPVFSLRREGSK